MSRRDPNTLAATPAMPQTETEIVKKLEADLEKAKLSLLKTQSEKTELKDKLSASETQITELKKKLTASENQVADLKAKLEAAQKALKELEELKKRNKELSDRIDETAKKLTDEAASRPKATATKAAPTGYTMLTGKEQSTMLEQLDVARAAAKAIGGLNETANERSDMLRRLLG